MLAQLRAFEVPYKIRDGFLMPIREKRRGMLTARESELPHAADKMNLRHAAFAATRWTAGSLLMRMLVQIAQTMILARILPPADFGLMAIIAAVYAIASLFVDLGLSSALIHFPKPSPTSLSTLYWLNLGAAFLCLLIFVALAWPLSVIYQQPDLPRMMLVLGSTMPLAALGQQFCALAEKDLRFSVIAVIEIVASGCGFAAATLVAYLGGGVYALIVSAPMGAAVTTALAWLFLAGGIRPKPILNFREVGPYLRYGAYRLGETLINSVQMQADVLIGGAVLGSGAMGTYSLPRNLALQIANTVVNPVVTRVGLPVMARLQDDREALKSAYLQTLRMTASVNFPVYAALAVWADQAVAILLGERWLQAGDYMRLFALWAMIRSTGNPVGSLLYATGRVRTAFWWNLAQLSVVPGVLWLAAKMGGTRGLAEVMVCVQLVVFYPLFRVLVRPASGARFSEYLGTLLPPLIASAIAVAIGHSISTVFLREFFLTRALVGGVIAAVAYLAASCIVNRPWLAAMIELMRPLMPARKTLK